MDKWSGFLALLGFELQFVRSTRASEVAPAPWERRWGLASRERGGLHADASRVIAKEIFFLLAKFACPDRSPWVMCLALAEGW
eukprot:5894358-Alexandrium_andersonii.AAC.1